ncbi:tetratricopeptide repeat protein [Promethearchaeum syntrophicum]|uniref:Tetratricopeptide repeat protein n=1 Tax=Promethearchaeum syntrophicum TaxID=2594042 RepID=A0A5B9D5Z0_9ARCH|nr:tetratricopeptide repeat protein [Candidatus Prometheoarchaeum syntrophicum]QEE14396.1 Tetratricopeptide repeat protein [Candidatus Prometheoarchaeum syntrophicum]
MEKFSQKILSNAEKLYYLGDFQKSLELLTGLEEKKEISPEEQCFISILRSKIFNALGEFTKELQSLELAYKSSQEIEDVSLLFDAIILKAEKAIEMGEKKQFFELIGKAENLFEENKVELLPKLGDISLSKGHYYSIMEVDYTQTLKFYNQCSEIYKKNNDKQKLAEIFIEIGGVMFYKGELDKSMLYYEKSLTICKKIGYKHGIAEIYNGFGILYSYTEDFHKSLMYMEKSLAIAEDIKYKNDIAVSLVNIGEMLYVQGDLKRAGEYYERSLKEYRALQNSTGIGYVLLDLIMLYIEMNYEEKVKTNFSYLEELYNQYRFLFKEIVYYYQIAEALILKKSTRMRDKVKAEQIFKEYAVDDNVDFQLTIIALLNWCELLLYELSISNDPEVLNEIQAIINKLLHLEEQQYNYNLIASTYLLQAKFALIQFKLKEAQQFLTKAQQVAQEKGLQLLAMKISAEHDEVLNQLDIWENLQKKSKQISMAERLKYAKLNEQMDSMIRTRAPEQLEILSEIPIFLSVISKGGTAVIKFPFLDKWADKNIFSSFISAFNVFSKELFSKSVDRVKMGENIILLNPIERFTACYVIKGPSYLAQQKLIRFSERIRATPEIWNRLNEYSNTGEILLAKENPPLKTIIDEVF